MLFGKGLVINPENISTPPSTTPQVENSLRVVSLLADAAATTTTQQCTEGCEDSTTTYSTFALALSPTLYS